MNLASWIVLGVVLVIVGLAIYATFFGKHAGKSCCDCGSSKNVACTGCAGCPACAAREQAKQQKQ